jgi:hypothetical protein
MKYFLAYFRAWWKLFKACSAIFIALWLIAGLHNVVALYLLYLICVGALAGPIGEWIK